VGPDSDTHAYEPAPAEVRAIASARIVVLNGLGFEGWMPRLLDAAEFHGTLVTAAKGVVPRYIQGHPDPHAWQDPRNVVAYVVNIAAALTAVMPGNAAQISQREAA
jgi:zinc/manganese transport system substrate-binding protein